MKRRTITRILIIVAIFNTILSIINIFVDYNQALSIEFNERLYDVFLDKMW